MKTTTLYEVWYVRLEGTKAGTKAGTKSATMHAFASLQNAEDTAERLNTWAVKAAGWPRYCVVEATTTRKELP